MRSVKCVLLLIALIGSVGVAVAQEQSKVTSPVLVREYKPNYTEEARKAKIEGVVVMEAVVLPDGTVGDINVKQSLDQKYGLDDEAVRTLKKWLFKPGTREGKPVPVLVVVEMTFTLKK